jgi:hypothetical protein
MPIQTMGFKQQDTVAAMQLLAVIQEAILQM